MTVRNSQWTQGALTAALTLTLVSGAAGAKQGGARPDQAGNVETVESEKAGTAADTVRVMIVTVPPRPAGVRWGRKALGPIPFPKALVVVRPRDSGPMELVIAAPGFLPVHTRADTFSDSRLAVKLTALDDKKKVFGYGEEHCPEDPLPPLRQAHLCRTPPSPLPPPRLPPASSLAANHDIPDIGWRKCNTLKIAAAILARPKAARFQRQRSRQ